MFHLFTLQGKRIDASLEHLPRSVRVHHTKNNNPVRKFIEGELTGYDAGTSEKDKRAADAYRESARDNTASSPVCHASEIMTSPVITTGPDEPAYNVWIRFMEKKIHHMPVISDDQKIIGIISDRDFLKKLIISNKKIETSGDFMVKDIMSSDVIAAGVQTDIRRIAKAMLDHHIGAMPVIDDNGLPAGIITRTDILYAIIHHQEIKFWA
jgi:acetoin utilization protein AcuB